jgi:acyl-CoA synthetase (AMP-forming)/AMP-acid ligase II
MKAPRARAANDNLLWEKWLSVVSKDPGAIAMTEADTGRTWTRLKLNAWADQLAAGPLAKAKGEFVAYSLPNGAEWMALFLALQQIGAAAVALDPALTAEQQDAFACALELRFVWRNGALHQSRCEGRKVGATRIGKVTSGSSGASRLVRCSAAHLLADGANIVRSMRISAKDRNLGLIPLGHSYGLGNLVAPLLLQGTSLASARAFVPRQIPDWIKKHRVTIFPAVPAMLRMLAALPGRARLGPLRLVISAGARLQSETARAFSNRFGLRVHNFYGSSETGGICFERRGIIRAESGLVGTPLAGVTVEITRQRRVRVRSQAVAAGRAGAFTLPDMGRLNEQGELELIGRAGRVANLGGRNIYPREIEDKLAQVGGVSDAWVEVLSKDGRDYLVAAAESPRSEQEIVSALGLLVPPWQRPRYWLVLPELPRTRRGKLDTQAMRARLSASDANRVADPSGSSRWQ